MQCIKKASESDCIWIRSEPNPKVYFIYAVVIPILALFGCVANCLNALVFMRPKMTPSVFTYLTILSVVDCLCCCIIFLISISRSICLNSTTWTHFDMRWQSPLFGTLTGAANWILVAVTLDRIIYLLHRLPQTPPKFCRRSIARRNTCAIMLMSAALNVPYYFIFLVRDDGSFYATDLFYSKIYKIHNWISFVVLCIMPGIFLLFGNIAVIIIFRRCSKKCKSLYSPGRKKSSATQSRQEHQLKLTITVITVVFLYMIGELPAHITSRKNALNLLFGGDVSKIDFEKAQLFEVIFLTLNALQLSLNILVHAVVNPSFMTEFFIFLREISDFVFLILGISAMQKCWKKLGNKYRCQEASACVGDVELEASISYYNEVFTIEEEPPVLIVQRNTERRWKSCAELRLCGIVSDERLRCDKKFKRHSLPF